MTEPPGCRPRRPSVSFELFPPRTPRGEEALWDAVDHLLAARPDFVSVTYGASGSTRDTSRDVVRRLLGHTAATPVAHLTCLGSTRDDLATIIEEFLDEGVRSFLALRGDPPAEATAWRPPPDGVATAAELVRLLRQVEARRRGDHPGLDLVGALRPLTVGVAAFPCGNRPLGGTREQDIAALLAKQEAGADYAITQLFFRAEDYLSYVAAARAAGVRIPVLPGVIPMTDPARLERVSRLTGIDVPAEVLAAIAAGSTEEQRYRRGLDATVELATAVLDGGAPGLHVYTFNTHRAALDLLDGVHLGGGAWTVADPVGVPHAPAVPARPGQAQPGPARPGQASPSPASPSPASPSPAQPSRGIT